MFHLAAQVYKTAIASLQEKDAYFEKGKMTRSIPPTAGIYSLLENFDSNAWKNTIRQIYSGESNENRKRIDWVIKKLDRCYPESVKRKYSGKPEISHMYRAMGFAAETGASVEWACAAGLHDIVEDYMKAENPLTYWLSWSRKAAAYSKEDESGLQQVLADISANTTPNVAAWVFLMARKEERVDYGRYLVDVYGTLPTSVIKGIDAIVKLPEYQMGNVTFKEKGLGKIIPQVRKLHKISWLLYEMALAGVKEHQEDTKYDGAWQYLNIVTRSNLKKLEQGCTWCDDRAYTSRVMTQSGPHGSRIVNIYGWNQIELPFVKERESGLYIAEKSFKDAKIPFIKMETMSSMLPKYIAQEKQIVRVEYCKADLKGKEMRLSENLRDNYDEYLKLALPRGYDRKEEVEEVLQGPYSPSKFKDFKDFAKIPLLENAVSQELSTRTALNPDEKTDLSEKDKKSTGKDGPGIQYFLF